jgi:hypothetical protein
MASLRGAATALPTPYQEGFAAAQNGEPRYKNPYIRGWDRHAPLYYIAFASDWFRGWRAAAEQTNTEQTNGR